MPLYWPPELKDKLRELIADTPEQYKKYVREWAAPAAENQAKKLGKSEIDEDCVIRGYITAVPRHLRDGIHDVLGEHNIDLMFYRPVFDEPNANLKTTMPFNQIDHHGASAGPPDQPAA